MRYGSVCSGIEAVSVAWKPLGWNCAFVAEVAGFARTVLAERWPDVPNLGDFTKITPEQAGPIDLLVGGTPCQPFSRVGLRKGLEDERGNLALEFARLCYRSNARWVVWENVSGVLTSGKGDDFAAFLSLLAGWDVKPPADGRWRKAGIVAGAPGCISVGWRVLDARYTRVEQFPRAVPQRRKRVVLVGYLGDWERVARVLFDGEMCGGDTPPVVAAGRKAARDAKRSARAAIPLDLTNLDGRVKHLPGKCYDEAESAAYTITMRRPSGVCVDGVARMLTPLECERAMGFPDGYTAVAWRGRDKEHTPKWSRYKALGNSMCVNVMAWIGERIDKVEKETHDG